VVEKAKDVVLSKEDVIEDGKEVNSENTNDSNEVEKE
jgi:hypothetical protein